MYLLRSSWSKCNVNSGRYCCMEFNMGLFILRCPYNLSFHLDHVNVKAGETRLAVIGIHNFPYKSLKMG